MRKLGHKHKRFVSGRGKFLDSTREGVHFFSKITSSLISDVYRVFLGRPVHTSNPRRWHHGWRRVEKFSKFVPPETVKIRSLALSFLRFLCKSFFKLLKLSLRKKIKIFKQKICMAISLWGLQSNLTLKDAVSNTEETHEAE